MRQKQLTSEKSILYTSQSSMVYMYCYCLFVQKCSRIIHLFTQCCDVIFRQVFLGFVVMENCNQRLVSSIQCKYLNTIFEYNDIVIFIYSNYPFHQNTKSSDTKCFTPSIQRVINGESRKLTPTVKDLLFLACLAFCVVTFEPVMI